VKRNRKGSRHRRQTLQVWTYEQARRVVPYVRSIMRSLRECQIEVQTHSLRAKRLAGQAGRPNRARILSQQLATEAVTEAMERVQKSLVDLHTLDIYCLDAIRGLALIPFVHDNQLAWFIFDLFEPGESLTQWRYHQDPIEKRRPIAEAIEQTPGNNYVV